MLGETLWAKATSRRSTEKLHTCKTADVEAAGIYKNIQWKTNGQNVTKIKDRIEHIYQTFPLANLGALPAGFNQPDAAT